MTVGHYASSGALTHRNLTELPMLSPHESLYLTAKRGLQAAGQAGGVSAPDPPNPPARMSR